MSEELQETQNPTQEVENTNQNYIEAINKLKSTTVSKEKYDQLKEENANLLNSLINGNQVTAVTESEAKPTAAELRKELFTKEHNDLEYAKLTLQLRDAVKEETGVDCFVSNSTLQPAKDEDYASAEKVAKVLQECIDNSNGDNGIFMAHLTNRINDIVLPQRKK